MNRANVVLHHLMATPAAEAVYARLADRDCVIVAATRTPIGSFGGVYANVTAPELGAHAIRGVLKNSGIDPQSVQEVFFGSVLRYLQSSVWHWFAVASGGHNEFFLL